MAFNTVSSPRISAPVAGAQAANQKQSATHRSALRGQEQREVQRTQKADAADTARASAHQRVEKNQAAAAVRNEGAEATVRHQRAEAKAQVAKPTLGGNIDTTA